MEHSELERIVNEYCDVIRKDMLYDIQFFDKDWNGLHVRALAQIIVSDDNLSIRKAKKQLTRSMSFYQMSV